MQKKEGPKIMLDSIFYDDEKLSALVEDKGHAMGYHFLVLLGILRQEPSHKLDTQCPQFSRWLAKKLQVAVTEVGTILGLLAHPDYPLLRTDGRYYWSERLLREIEYYITKGREGAAKRYGGNYGPQEAPNQAAMTRTAAYQIHKADRPEKTQLRANLEVKKNDTNRTIPKT